MTPDLLLESHGRAEHGALAAAALYGTGRAPWRGPYGPDLIIFGDFDPDTSKPPGITVHCWRCQVRWALEERFLCWLCGMFPTGRI